MKNIRNPPTIPPSQINGLAAINTSPVPVDQTGNVPENQIANAIVQKIAAAKGISPRNMNKRETFKACNMLTK